MQSIIQQNSILQTSFLEGEPSDNQPTASVLIVDDEKALRLILRRALEKEGYRTIATNSAEHGLYLCQRQLPDIILLDAVMPGMDGFWCCSQLTTMFGDRCPPILMITALYDAQSIDKAFAAGATDFITKPIHWAILKQRVKRLLETCKLAAQWQASLQQEKLLKAELEAAMQQIKYLNELGKSNKN